MAPHRPRVFLDVSIGTEPSGRLTIELFNDKAPKTCDNFRALCTGSHPPLTYKMSRFHRVVDEFMVQGGDITKGDGTGGDSIYGGEFGDESPDWREIDEPGLVCMANRGKGTNSSQFFITLVPSQHLNGKHTVFGQLVSGHDTLRRIANVQVDENDRPLADVIVTHCGELERRTKKQTRPSASQVHDRVHAPDDTESTDRGRGKRRRSPDSHVSSSRSRSHSSSHAGKHRKHTHGPAPMEIVPTKKRHRRRSDHSVDENLRGRPRRRSGDRGRASSPIAEDEDSHMADDRESSVSRHGRRRSRSPSRNREDKSSPSTGYRRRRSLPNHYEKRKEYLRGGDGDATGAGQVAGRMDSEQSHDNRRGDRLRAPRGFAEHGRLGNEGGWAEDDAGGGSEIKFKGRGSMKYRERKRFDH